MSRPRGDVAADRSQRADDDGTDPGARRRASRSLWAACEALLSAADPRALARALDRLAEACDCEGVALHVVGPDGTFQPWCARGAWRTAPGDLRGCLSVPLCRGEERIGTLDLLGRPGQSLHPGQMSLIRTAAGALGAALGARLELQRLRSEPGRDPLTGLPDARAFHARLENEMSRARRHGYPLGLAFVDLDHFGALNQRYGRAVGDAVLAEAALVLRLALRESDLIARMGGDQFGVLLPETDLNPARRCGERLRHALEEHRFARVGRLSASIGVTASPRGGVEGIELVASGDQALALAKKSGRRRVKAIEPAPVH
ncbi:MAG: GGDEF domain-containing protein [Candidatus Eisenbacteria bacterium]|uniref:GGDEF domain-containing protein n=1 Tax=Eiseniibacteriota bacterium TaxID=2212470 RepID=A0A538U5M7_UNCEI|nr:MAG: GGDEF domain-containing protein [Candidatus Eisenbacteria bacterium]